MHKNRCTKHMHKTDAQKKQMQNYAMDAKMQNVQNVQNMLNVQQKKMQRMQKVLRCKKKCKRDAKQMYSIC